jgi:ACT domain-containing protein
VKKGVDDMLPDYLSKMIKRELFIDYKKGMSVKDAVKAGTRKAIDAWRKRNADKSGG